MRLVLRVGGSVVASPINTELISRYTELLKKLKLSGHEIIAVVGGGTLAREFIQIAKELSLDEEAQDEIAIAISRIFAQLFIKKLGDISCNTVPLTLDDAKAALREGKIVIMGGLKPGMTTDSVAALVAEHAGADLLVKGTDQDGVYNKDPRKHSDAVKLNHLSFDDLANVFSENKHKAGIHQIIDPEAVKILKRRRTKLIVVNGFNPENILAAVSGESVGTVIS
ncbi:MAG: UMP kinase [Candidatus Bathyarchaeia archaeon]